jgi:predicted peptidase
MQTLLVAMLAGTSIFAVQKGVQATVSLPEETAKQTKYLNRKFLVYTPGTYSESKDKPCPLMIFLHGMGERGEDLKLVRKHGPPRIVKKKDDFPFLLVSPQCLKGEKGKGMWRDGKGWWKVEDLELLLKFVKKKYNVDENRVYLTGLSMGGFGTWAWAAEHPERFAAIAPICGGGDPKKAKKYGSMPIWAFHGDRDRAVPLQKSQEMVDAVRAVKGNVKFTVYKGVGHNSWDRAYDTEELYTWLLEQKRKPKSP